MRVGIGIRVSLLQHVILVWVVVSHCGVAVDGMDSLVRHQSIREKEERDSPTKGPTKDELRLVETIF